MSTRRENIPQFNEKRPTMIERGGQQLNFNTVVGIIALATIGWVGTKTAGNNESLTKIETTLPYVTQSVLDLKTQISQLVTRSELESRFAELSAKQSSQDQRLMKLEYEKKRPTQDIDAKP